jgi:hypothetical protein
MFARLAVQLRGGLTRPLRWEFAEGRDFASQRQRVVSQVEDALDELTAATGAVPVVIGKSLVVTAVEDFLDNVVWPRIV